MNYNWSIADTMETAKSCHTTGIKEFIERIKKEIGFVENNTHDNAQWISYDYDENGFTKCVSFHKKGETWCTGSFKVIPINDGKFNLVFFNDKGEKLREKNDLNVTIFLFDQFKEGISILKFFWEHLRLQ